MIERLFGNNEYDNRNGVYEVCYGKTNHPTLYILKDHTNVVDEIKSVEEVKNRKIEEIEIPDIIKKETRLDIFVIKNNVCVKVLFSGVSCKNLNLDEYDTTGLDNTENMFENCRIIENVDLSGCNLSNVTSMSGMFRNAQIGTLNLSGLDLSNVTNMYDMFSNAQIGTLDLTGVKLLNVENMSCMFYEANIKEIKGFDRIALAMDGVINVDSMMYQLCSPDTENLNSSLKVRLEKNKHFENEKISDILDKSEDEVKSYRFKKLQIRKNITKFANDTFRDLYNNSEHKKDFEKLLMSFKNNIVESLFGVLFKTHGYNSNIKTVLLSGILVNEIVLSDKLKKKFYDLYNPVDFVEGPNKNVEEANENVEDSDENIKDSDKGFYGRILGEYYSKEKKIVLYVENMKKVINKDRKSEHDLEDLFLSVLIHELFHAVHDKYCEEYNIPFGQQEHEIITESLAAAFEYYFCDKVLNNTYLMSKLKDSWEKHSVLVYPYSGARSMVPFQGEDKIREIRQKLCSKSNGNLCSTNLYNKMKNMNVDNLHYVRNYFMLSLVSMEQAQMDLLRECL